MINNEKKQEMCEKHSNYLKIIYYFGNKIMLMKQLYMYAEKMRLATNYNQFHRHIQELIDAEVIKTEPFVALQRKTQLYVIVLRKYALRFVEGKNSSKGVGAVPKTQSAERILLSVFKNTYMLDKIMPRLEKENTPITLKNIIELLNRDNSSLLYNKNQGLAYFINLYKKNKQILNETQSELFIEKMKETKIKMLKGLYKGAKSTIGKGKGNAWSGQDNATTVTKNMLKKIIKEEDTSTEQGNIKKSSKEFRLRNTNINTLLNAFTYVVQVKKIQDIWTITLLQFDIFNNIDIYKFALNVAAIYHMFNVILKVDFKITIGLIVHDDTAITILENDANKKTRHFYTKEKNRLTYLKKCLSENHIDELMQKNIEIIFTSYRITDTYMDGVKYKNLYGSRKKEA